MCVCGGGGGGQGGSGVVAVGSKDNKHKVLLKNKYVAIIFLYICCFCVILFQLVKCCNPKKQQLKNTQLK